MLTARTKSVEQQLMRGIAKIEEPNSTAQLRLAIPLCFLSRYVTEFAIVTLIALMKQTVTIIQLVLYVALLTLKVNLITYHHGLSVTIKDIVRME